MPYAKKITNYLY